METKHGDVIFCTGGYDHTIRFWNIEEANCYHILQHPDSQINDMDISKDGKFVAAAGYRHLRVYDIQSNNTNAILNYEGHTKNICSVGFNENNTWLYSLGEDGSAYILDHRVNNATCQRSKQLQNITPSCGLLHPNQIYMIFGSREGKLYVWDLRANELRIFIPEPQSPILSVSIDKMGINIAVANDQGLCSIWPMELIEAQFSTIDNSKVSSSLCVDKRDIPSQQQPLLNSTLENNSVDPLKTKTVELNAMPPVTADASPKPIQPIYLPLHKSHQFKGHTRYVLKNQLSHDSKLLVTCSDDGNALIWDVTTANILHKFPNPNRRWIWDSTFTKDSLYLLTGSSDCKARLWEVESGTLKREFSGHQKAITCLALKD